MRKIINLNDNWQFIQKDVGLVNVMPTEWQTVSLPHTWNAVDGHDGNGSYDRGCELSNRIEKIYSEKLS